MFCRKCGAEMDDEAIVCIKCGCGVEKEQKKQGNGIAIAGFVCSFFIPILGWIFGGIGLSRANKRNGKGAGFSIASIAISTVTFLINIAAII